MQRQATPIYEAQPTIGKQGSWRRRSGVQQAGIIVGVLVLVGAIAVGAAASTSGGGKPDTTKAVAYNQATTTTKQATTTTTDATTRLERAADEYWAKVGGTLQQWDDLVSVAGATPRISLSGVITQLQAVERQIESLNIPKEPKEIWIVHTDLKMYMSAMTTGYVWFMADQPDSMVNEKFNEAESWLDEFTNGLASLRTSGVLPSTQADPLAKVLSDITSTTEDPLVAMLQNAVPLGQGAQVGDWKVKVRAVTLDATQAIVDEHGEWYQLEDGSQYVLVDLQATYTGREGGELAASVSGFRGTRRRPNQAKYDSQR